MTYKQSYKQIVQDLQRTYGSSHTSDGVSVEYLAQLDIKNHAHTLLERQTFDRLFRALKQRREAGGHPNDIEMIIVQIDDFKASLGSRSISHHHHEALA